MTLSVWVSATAVGTAGASTYTVCVKKYFIKTKVMVFKVSSQSAFRIVNVSPQVSLSVFSLVSDLLFDCSPVLEYAKIRSVLQSTLPSTPIPLKGQTVGLFDWSKRTLLKRVTGIKLRPMKNGNKT